MGRCSCIGATCQCVIGDSTTIDFSGAGSAAVPYSGQINPPGVAPLLISADAGNELVLGSDGLLKTRGVNTLHVFATPVCNVGGGVVTLDSYSVAAGTLASNFDRLKFRAEIILTTFLFDFNGFEVFYGGVSIFSHPAVSGIDSVAIVEGEIIRTGPATLRSSVSASFTDNGSGASKVEAKVTALALSNATANLFEVKGESSAAATQVCLNTLSIDYFPF